MLTIMPGIIPNSLHMFTHLISLTLFHGDHFNHFTNEETGHREVK